MTIFEQIKERLDIVDVVQHYGIAINRAGFGLCPFHSEKTPSLSFKGNRYKCFGCGAGGDVLDMVAHIRGITTLEAARELDAIYSLRLFENQPDRAEIRHRAQQAQAARERLEAFKEWEQWACNTIAAYLRLMEAWKRDLAPKAPEDDINPLFVEACNKLGYYDYLCTEIFINGGFTAKADFYKTHSKEVEAIARRIDKFRENQAA